MGGERERKEPPTVKSTFSDQGPSRPSAPAAKVELRCARPSRSPLRVPALLLLPALLPQVFTDVARLSSLSPLLLPSRAPTPARPSNFRHSGERWGRAEQRDDAAAVGGEVGKNLGMLLALLCFPAPSRPRPAGSRSARGSQCAALRAPLRPRVGPGRAGAGSREPRAPPPPPLPGPHTDTSRPAPPLPPP